MKKIVVMSNKGGVGKSLIAANLAYALAMKAKTGLLDIDIHGPNASAMLGVEGRARMKDGKIIPLEKYGIKIVSPSFFMDDNSKAVIWRGPIKTRLVMQFIKDIEWGDVEYVVVDMPPGTGDEAITIAQFFKDAHALIVSTPQQASLLDARRAINFAKEMGMGIAGVIENMSSDVFGRDKVRAIAEEEGVEFLGSIELSKKINDYAEQGKPFVSDKKMEEAKRFMEIVEKIVEKL